MPGRTLSRPSAHLRIAFLLITLLVHITPGVLSQQTDLSLSGIVRDFETNESLPHTNIRVLGTTWGATTNRDGIFRVRLPVGSHVLVFSYLGYRSDTLHIDISNQNLKTEIRLLRSSVSLPEITVFGDDPNPAEEIIRRAIAKKKETLALLHTYEFSAHNKLTSSVVKKEQDQQDTMRVALVLESQTKGYWKSPGQLKEIITARRQTSLFPAEYNIFGQPRLSSLNDDEVNIFGRKVVGPTASNAFKHYSFEMLDTTSIDNLIVWRIQMTPKTNVYPLFDGVISIADGSFLVMEVDVRGNDALNESPLLNIHIRQQFARYDDTFWLPILSSVKWTQHVWAFTRKIASDYAQTSVVHDYVINRDLPEDIFDEFSLKVSSTADQVDTLRWRELQSIPLTPQEERAYAFWDSVASTRSWRRDVIFFLLRSPITVEKLPITSFSDFYRFNRVEGSYVGIGFQSKDYLGLTRLTLRSGYGTADRRWKYELGIEQDLSVRGRTSVGGSLFRGLRVMGDQSGFSPMAVTFVSLWFKDDPLDYYEATGWHLFARHRPHSEISIVLGLLVEDGRSVQRNTNFSLFGRASYRPNPPVDDGPMRSFRLSFTQDTRKYIDAGLFKIDDYSREISMISAQYEHADPALLGGVFRFDRFNVDTRHRFHTFGSGMIELRFRAGWSSHPLPPQRIFTTGARTGEIVSKYAFLSGGADGLVGDRLVVTQIEHDFGSMIFRWLGITQLKDIRVALYAGSGWSDARGVLDNRNERFRWVAKRIFHEAGFSIGMISPFPMSFSFTWPITYRERFSFGWTFGSGIFW